MNKIVTVLGARPQFIKAAVVSRAFTNTTGVEEIIVHTGQHYDIQMSDIFFSEMNIPKPRYNLGAGGKTQGAMTGDMLIKVEEVLIKEKPDWVLVYGDTNSTLAGALAACKLHIPIAHVEAGLRSFNINMPEEINRILTDRVSNLHFCPTDTAVENLLNEGFSQNSIKKVGDVMLDAVLYYKDLAAPTPKITNLLERLPEFALATIHRAENTDDPLRLNEIISGLKKVAEKIPVLMPLHPRTQKQVKAFGVTLEPIAVIEPVGYFDMICLIQKSHYVFTDSGGLQKEAYFFAKPCVTLRDETEWVELVKTKANILAGANSKNIVAAFENHAGNQINSQNFYGNGKASDAIVQQILDFKK